jgi:hypothetical protein
VTSLESSTPDQDHGTPDERVSANTVAAAKLCVAGMLRQGVTPPWGADVNGAYPCYYASEAFRTTCFGDVVKTAAGVTVTGSEARDGDCTIKSEVELGLRFIAGNDYYPLPEA